MKKLCSIFIILLLTGCRNELKCNVVEKFEDYSITEAVVYSFKNDEIVNGEYILKVKVNSNYKNYINKFKNSLILEYTNLYDIGVKRKISIKDNNIKFVLNYKGSKFAKEEKELLIKHGLYVLGNYDQVKNELEKDGYKCN